MFGGDIGIDLGTASVIVYIKGHGIVLNEPSVVAVERGTNEIVAIGVQAQRMLGRTPDNIIAMRPLREGVISNYDITEKMLRYFINKAIGRSFFRKPRIAVCVPSQVTEVEQRSVLDATRKAGARQVFVIEEPIAAAIGAGIDISRACGSMIIDIGGGTTDVAVISLGSCVVSESVKVAGDHLDEAIIRYMRRKYSMLIGERTAEELKINIGSAFELDPPLSMEARGRNLTNGLPITKVVTSDDMREALAEPIAAIIDTVRLVLEQTPPELSSDISDRGIIMTGGSSQLQGLDKLISQETGIETEVANDTVSSVAYGTGKYIEFITSNTYSSSDVTRRGIADILKGISKKKPGKVSKKLSHGTPRGSERRREHRDGNRDELRND
jgi:rod shape-determining protein MreB